MEAGKGFSICACAPSEHRLGTAGLRLETVLDPGHCQLLGVLPQTHYGACVPQPRRVVVHPGQRLWRPFAGCVYAWVHTGSRAKVFIVVCLQAALTEAEGGRQCTPAGVRGPAAGAAWRRTVPAAGSAACAHAASTEWSSSQTGGTRRRVSCLLHSPLLPPCTPLLAPPSLPHLSVSLLCVSLIHQRWSAESPESGSCNACRKRDAVSLLVDSSGVGSSASIWDRTAHSLDGRKHSR